jgi:hypothetical protein
MRSLIIATTALVGLAATPAMAQADRYGGVSTYAPPQSQAPQPASARVLQWGGKTIPAQSVPQYGGYGYPRYFQARPAYGAQLGPAPYAQDRGAPPAPYQVERRAQMYPGAPQQPQAYAAYPAQPAYPPQPAYPAQPAYPPQAAAPQMAPPVQPYYGRQIAGAAQPQAGQASYPSPYQTQPYYAPAPTAAAPPPGSTATAPSGVYPTNTVPPQLAGPNVIPPQVAQPLVTNPQAPPPAPPTSIYAPPPTARIGEGSPLPAAQPDPTDPRENQRVAMNTAQPAQTARYYSLHRQFGLQPDPTPPLPADDAADAVELVSSIDSGVGVEPAPETRTKVVQTTKGKTTTAILRGARDDDDPS